MYAQAAKNTNTLLRNGAYGIVMRGVQKCTRGCSSLRGRKRLPLCCIKLDTATDPGCKNGVFLREIAKRLNEGLKDQIPDVEQRMDNIMKKQLFAIAITQITALLSRRSVYCSKDASSQYSVVKFNNPDGNIRYKRIEHTWVDGRCSICGASKEVQNRDEVLESHAYEFIHMNGNELKEFGDMKYDVIIGNPPYQLNVGVEKEKNAVPIYDIISTGSWHLETAVLM